MRGHRQHVRRNEAAVGDDDTEVSLDALDAPRDVGSLERGCLQQFNATRCGYFRHR